MCAWLSGPQLTRQVDGTQVRSVVPDPQQPREGEQSLSEMLASMWGCLCLHSPSILLCVRMNLKTPLGQITPFLPRSALSIFPTKQPSELSSCLPFHASGCTCAFGTLGNMLYVGSTRRGLDQVAVRETSGPFQPRPFS